MQLHAYMHIFDPSRLKELYRSILMLYFKQDKVQLGDNILTFKAQITTTTTTKKLQLLSF